MLPTHFKRAMFNRSGVGPFQALSLSEEQFRPRVVGEWLIVERIGKDLWISDGNIPAELQDLHDRAPAPAGLAENLCLYATHYRTDIDGCAASFLLGSLPPAGEWLAATLLPASGIVHLRADGAKISMWSEGWDGSWAEERSWTSYTDDNDAHAAIVVPESGRWSFQAEERPWSSAPASSALGEFALNDPRSAVGLS